MTRFVRPLALTTRAFLHAGLAVLYHWRQIQELGRDRDLFREPRRPRRVPPRAPQQSIRLTGTEHTIAFTGWKLADQPEDEAA